jgi:hypothetical protein
MCSVEWKSPLSNKMGRKRPWLKWERRSHGGIGMGKAIVGMERERVG